MTMLSNAMDLLEVGGYVQQILLGCVIIAAISSTASAPPALSLCYLARIAYRACRRHNR